MHIAIFYVACIFVRRICLGTAIDDGTVSLKCLSLTVTMS